MNPFRDPNKKLMGALLILTVAITVGSSMIAVFWRANAGGGTRVLLADDITQARGSTQGSLDYAADRGQLIAHPTPYILASIARRNPSVILNGWAVDSPDSRLAAGVYAVVDNDLSFHANYGLSRPDVADALRNAGFVNCGFQVAIPATIFTRGKHSIELRVISNDASGYYVFAPPIQIVL